MRTRGALVACFLAGGFLRHAQGGCHECYQPRTDVEEVVLTARPHEYLSLKDLPSHLDWRMKDGHNYASFNRNQHIPKYCGACWSFAATSSLADRIRIARGPSSRPVSLAVQVVLNCDTGDKGCGGGDPVAAYSFIHQIHGLPEESCQTYEASAWDVGRSCEAVDICRKCDENGCHAVPEYLTYPIAEFGYVAGELHMMAELQRGPIACAVATPPLFDGFTGTSIYEDTTHDHVIDHIVSVAGYGTENGVRYWIVRNSWGTYWGHVGWGRVIRGKNNIMIETACAWAVPDNKGEPVVQHANSSKVYALAKHGFKRWQDLAKMGFNMQMIPRAARPKGTPIEQAPAAAPASATAVIPGGAAEPAADAKKAQPEGVLESVGTGCRVPWNDWESVGGERILSPRPHEVLAADAVPKAWDWRNISGVNYATWDKNENIPRKCASCWAQAVTSVLSDRLSISRRAMWPVTDLSPQVLINCHGGGSCLGGNPAGAYAYVHKNGITDGTCQNYQATDLGCDDISICENCAPGNVEASVMWPGKCVAVQSPIVHHVSEYGSVRGAANMKAEIYQRGPIGCGMESTNKFQSYTGGIYSEFRYFPLLNIHVAVAGWGVAGVHESVPEGTEFWAGRNSVGTYWGELGWFRIVMHDKNLGIELDCDWGIPQEASPVPSTVTSSMFISPDGLAMNV